jgi:hypothetical protein
MPVSPPIAEIVEELSFPVTLSEDLDGIRKHLKDVIEGEAFRGSNRSGQFLRHIVEEAVAGRQENLKERLLGIEIFGRAPSYDTGEDAIVRVTASDVRRRLLQHYGRSGDHPAYRFSLSPGTYVPRITLPRPAVPASASTASPAVTESLPDTSAKKPIEPVPSTIGSTVSVQQRWRILAIILLGTNLFLGIVLWQRVHAGSNPLLALLPWSELLSNQAPTLLITSDPNIAEIEGITGSPLSLSDYANHVYVPHPELLTPEQLHFCNVILRGDKASNVDSPIAASVAAVAASKSKPISVRGARTIQLSDLQGDKNLVLLGSLRSDPWISLFANRLDFRFEFEPTSLKEIIRNVHPRQGEAQTYVATAPGWATGESYALMALLQNPDGTGHVLLLGGENGEGTEAAGKLLNDAPRLRATLSKCGISSESKDKSFEVLLHLNTLAGSPNNVAAIACHIM